MILRAGLLALLLAVASCSTIKTTPDPALPLATADTWQVAGKLGVRYQDQGDNLGFTWKQDGDHYDIRMRGPLGIAVADVQGSSAGVTLQAGDEVMSAASPEALMREALGYELPVSLLRYWIRGIPGPGLAHVTAVDGFDQAGWQVRYPSQGLLGPDRITINRDDMRLRLVGLKWQL